MALFSRKKKNSAATIHIDPHVGNAGSAIASPHTSTVAASPAPYVVKSGDTLNAIAKAHGLSLSQLEHDNPQIANPNLIQPGEKIYLNARTETDKVTTVLNGGGSGSDGTHPSSGGASIAPGVGSAGAQLSVPQHVTVGTGAPVPSGPPTQQPASEHHKPNEHHKPADHHPSTGGAPVAPPEHQPASSHHPANGHHPDPVHHPATGGAPVAPASSNQAEIDHLQAEAKQDDAKAASLDSKAKGLEEQAISLHVKAHTDGASKVGAENHLKELEGELADAKKHHKAGTVQELNTEITKVSGNAAKLQSEQDTLNSQASGIEQQAAQDIATANLDKQAATQAREQAGTLKIDHSSQGGAAPAAAPADNTDPASAAAPVADNTDPTDSSTDSGNPDPSSGGDPAQAAQFQDEAAQFQSQADQFSAQASQDQQAYAQDVATANQDRATAAQDLSQTNALEADAEVQKSQSAYWHDLAHTAGANKVGSLNHLQELEKELNAAESHHQAGEVQKLKGEINAASDNANTYQAKQDQYNNAASMFDNKINSDNAAVTQDQQAAAALNSQADQFSAQAAQDQQNAANAQAAAAEYQSKADQANQQANGFLTSSTYNNLPGTQASDVHANTIAGGGTIGVAPANDPVSALADPNPKK